MELVRVTEVPSPCAPSTDVDFAVHCAVHSSNDIATVPHMCEVRPHCAEPPLLTLKLHIGYCDCRPQHWRGAAGWVR